MLSKLLGLLFRCRRVIPKRRFESMFEVRVKVVHTHKTQCTHAHQTNSQRCSSKTRSARIAVSLFTRTRQFRSTLHITKQRILWRSDAIWKPQPLVQRAYKCSHTQTHWKIARLIDFSEQSRRACRAHVPDPIVDQRRARVCIVGTRRGVLDQQTPTPAT